jgi:hypothetical protein
MRKVPIGHQPLPNLQEGIDRTPHGVRSPVAAEAQPPSILQRVEDCEVIGVADEHATEQPQR